MTRRAPAAERARYAFIHDIGVCAATGRDGDIHAAHLRGPAAVFGKPITGMSIKPHYVWTLPLSPEMHAYQHEIGEKAFWLQHSHPWHSRTRSPLAAALILEGFHALGDVDAARAWLQAWAR